MTLTLTRANLAAADDLIDALTGSSKLDVVA
jgi:hypothetical protein